MNDHSIALASELDVATVLTLLVGDKSKDRADQLIKSTHQVNIGRWLSGNRAIVSPTGDRDNAVTLVPDARGTKMTMALDTDPSAGGEAKTDKKKVLFAAGGGVFLFESALLNREAEGAKFCL